ncbi:MAG: NUDIX hydrolase [Terracoccus sp.]
MPSPATDQPDQQPTLTDGDLVLRPWTRADPEPTRLRDDTKHAYWFDSRSVTPSSPQHLAWVETTHDEWALDRSKATFLVELDGEPVGSVDVRRRDLGIGVLSWLTYAPYRGKGIASRAVRLLIEWAFSEAGLGLRRVEAQVHPLNTSSLRTALRSGLRREGLLRGNTVLDGSVHDTVMLGRLADDPAPGTRDGFTAMLNSELPTKRVIAQGLVRNSAGAILLCELAYKSEWDLPGGIVDPGESPAACLVREIREELDVEVEVTRLAAVNWLKPWLGWADAVLFVFEVAPVGDDLLDRVHLLERELKGAHWTPMDEAARHVAAYNARMLSSLAAGRTDATLLLEDGLPRP